MRLEQLLVTNGYTKEDMIIVTLPTADQISVIISSASLLADSQDAGDRKNEGRKISTSSIDKKVSFDCEISIKEEEQIASIVEATVEGNKNLNGAETTENCN